ncbi:MAG: type IV pilus assembly protein PilX [Arenicella sp.]|jgi:type IV pilus assembly protein PilX
MKNIQNNNGIALFISLVFLFVSTLLGVTSLRSNFFNEKMTLNIVQREQAFEAAEVALLTGEQFVETFSRQIITQVISGSGVNRIVTTNGLNCEGSVAGGGGLCVPREQFFNDGNAGGTVPPSDVRQHNWVDITGDTSSINAWTNPNRHRKLSDVLQNRYGFVTAPKYIIEFMGHIVDITGESLCASTGGTVNPLEGELALWPYCSIDSAQFRVTALATSGNYDETRVMLQTTYLVDTL